ncbi:Integration host factor (IHF)-like DNA-binding domain,Histone-like DNA-binding protein [Cinara cedri]|uniref:Integration host factor (IHF)-like DNA-binding domain,Histone-like DNA-binding protein n=2 Tax=Cinara cedri TaxID=506608 RepID=A0A5E4M672_9HEMI|nr:Integration host factor (IHF)-like DNA-binding domain,Histone-like DNA-binding protein [Cinara cedri]
MKRKSQTLTKLTIAEKINQEIGLSKKDSAAMIDNILDEIKAYLVKDGVVKISSFGTLVVNKKRERPGNVPNGFKKVIIKEKKSISFRPSRIIKNLINTDE